MIAGAGSSGVVVVVVGGGGVCTRPVLVHCCNKEV